MSSLLSGGKHSECILNVSGVFYSGVFLLLHSVNTEELDRYCPLPENLRAH